jgi:trans-2,3-dihydro-3-hydroxyanthranilate isomerase
MKGRTLRYLLLDVFTSRPLSGNPLAVVRDADGLLDDEMQAIAREFNLSETVFLMKPHAERNTAAVRIFTPSRELPFAGHPTVGAAVVLGLGDKTLPVVRIEETVGTITALVQKDAEGRSFARFGLPRLPDEAGRAPDRAAVALALGVMPEEVGCGLYKPGLYTAGVPYYLLPVRDAAVLARIKLERRGWAETFPHGAAYVFTETPGEPGINYAARMFAPGHGFSEDPGTGGAAAALIGLLALHTSFADGQAEYVLRQGDEMGRPCRIHLQIRKEAGVLTHGSIGGHAVVIGEGELMLG